MPYLLDTSAILAHFRDEPGADQVQALFDQEEEALMLCSVSIPEFASRLRALGISSEEALDTAKEYGELVDDVISVDTEVAESSFELICRSPERLPMVDALIASAAMQNQATLVHRDAHMSAIPSDLCEQYLIQSQ